MALYSVLLKPTREGFIDTITPDEAEAVSDHFSYFKQLLDKGLLLFAGRCDNASFGIALFDGATESHVYQMMQNDPAVRAGVFHFEVSSFSIALLNTDAFTAYAG